MPPAQSRMNTLHNFRTGKNEDIPIIPPDRALGFIPQTEESRSLYNHCRVKGMTITSSIVKVLTTHIET